MRSQIGIVILFMLLLVTTAQGHDWAHGDFVQSTQFQREWFQKQKRPGTSLTCCNEADGEQVDEQILYDQKGIGHYWIYSKHTRGEWMQVPVEAVINEPNLHGRPIAWFRWMSPDGSFSVVPRRDLSPTIFCFAPGPLL